MSASDIIWIIREVAQIVTCLAIVLAFLYVLVRWLV